MKIKPSESSFSLQLLDLDLAASLGYIFEQIFPFEIKGHTHQLLLAK